jgi:phosphocarrier protein HPr
MSKFTYVIKDEVGIHARPAGLLVKEAKKYASAVTLEVNGKKADAKKLMAVMTLGAKTGQELTVTVEGTDEAEAARALQVFLEENL